MSQSQVVSFRASGHFLNWIEAQRLDGESVNQAAQRILKEVSGTSTTLSKESDTNLVPTVAAESVDILISDRLAPLIKRIAVIEERLEKLKVD
ncbi:hypothetical protein IQ270_25425 [Microcoleus sp. LEGE 07076]|uniref:hypothetical protein n=1 Tax=Microcoleus sp. LEGE 07076 TaxID=915322 RepID=UPI00188174E0|nr:hypothetical protein [Microcoleus sp. LEGE 07076]MBE9187889.1 hypothetical protein [Microcoleus sp. LEGE 07076]